MLYRWLSIVPLAAAAAFVSVPASAQGLPISGGGAGLELESSASALPAASASASGSSFTQLSHPSANTTGSSATTAPGKAAPAAAEHDYLLLALASLAALVFVSRRHRRSASLPSRGVEPA